MDATFYYDFNSPYAYLAAERISGIVPQARWQPIAFAFLLRHQGRVPWSLGDGRDAGIAEVEQRAAERGLPPLRWVEGWPRETYSLAPLRAALVAEEAGRLREFSLAVFRTFFVDGRPLGEPEALGDAAENAGLDPAAVLEGAERDEVKSRLQHVTEQAIELGVPGVPTVAVGDELFWGDDRLEDAAAARK